MLLEPGAACTKSPLSEPRKRSRNPRKPEGGPEPSLRLERGRSAPDPIIHSGVGARGPKILTLRSLAGAGLSHSKQQGDGGGGGRRGSGLAERAEDGVGGQITRIAAAAPLPLIKSNQIREM